MLLFTCLLLGPALAGCLGAREEGPRLATPTDQAPVINQEKSEAPTPPTKPRDKLDLSDPGYVIGKGWSKGDAWFYLEMEDKDRYRYMEVLEVIIKGNRTFYTLEDSTGIPGNYPKYTSRITVDGDNWTRMGATSNGDNVVRFDPPAPNVRFHRNGTFEYTEYGQGAGLKWRDKHIVNSYFVGTEVVKLEWADASTAIIEHRDVVTRHDGTQSELLVRHWVDRRYLNDVAFEVDAKDFYLLQGVRIDGRLYGHIPPYV